MHISNSLSYKHLFKGSAIYGSADVIVAIVRFLLIAVYTRILSPAEFGLYAILTTSLMLANVFIPLGIPSAVMLKLGEKKSLDKSVEKDSAFIFLFLLCIVCGVLFFILSQFGGPKYLFKNLTLWLILYISSDVLSAIPKVSLRLHENIRGFNTAKILRVFAMAILLLILVKNGVRGITAIIIAEASATFLELTVCMVIDNFLPFRFSFFPILPLLRVGLPLTMIGFGIVCIDLSDRYVVSSILGTQANGFYAAAAKIAVAASFFAEAFNSMWFPYFLRITAKSNFGITEDMQRFSKRLIVLFAAAISFLILVLPCLVDIKIAGKEFVARQYHEVSVLIGPLVLAYFFKIVFYISSAALIAQKKSRPLVIIVYCAALVNIGGDIFVAFHFGGRNVFFVLSIIALMTSVAYAICMVCVAKVAGMFPYRFWALSPYVWTSFLCLTLAFLPIPLFARIACLSLICAGFFVKSFLIPRSAAG